MRTRRKSFSPGAALLIDATQDHTLRLYGQPYVRTIVHFDPAILSPKLLQHPTLWRDLHTWGFLKAELCAAAQGRITSWLDGLFGALHEAQPGEEALVSAYLQLILVEFNRHRVLCLCGVRQAGTANAHLVGAVLWYVEHHLADSVTLHEIARDLAISPRHLERRFKDVTGTSLKAFWVEKRMEQATALLRAGPAGVAEVARMVGYASPHAFSRAFKRHVGVSPSNLREEAQPEGVAVPVLARTDTSVSEAGTRGATEPSYS